MDSSPWTCPCGHELDPAGRCVVWDRRLVEHIVDRDGSRCLCHGTPLKELEKR